MSAPEPRERRRVEPEPAPDPDALPRDAADAERRLDAAVALFDAGRYHDAHEELEALWLATQGADSDFYKGLIQAAIALHHYAEGNGDGARGLYAGHRRLLAAYLPRHRGVDVAGLLAAMQACLRPVLAAAPGEEPPFDPERRPRLSRESGAG